MKYSKIIKKKKLNLNYRDTSYVVKNYASKWTDSKKYFYTLEKILNTGTGSNKQRELYTSSKKLLKNGGKLIFPFPDSEII